MCFTSGQPSTPKRASLRGLATAPAKQVDVSRSLAAAVDPGWCGITWNHMMGAAATIADLPGRVLRLGICSGLATCVGLVASPACGEGLLEALAKAYQANPQLNAERAHQRATDENVPQALAGYRPQITGSLS